ncbi:MAG TPA: response regulator [Ktedonobacteraceae bacterium]|nr:response regulator [Ktedonobacteraceae bacterium]
MKSGISVLLVNRNQRNLDLLSDFLSKAGYIICAAGTLEAFDHALAEDSIVVALVDITGFDSGVWERCEQLRRKKKPFLVVSTRQSAAIQQASISHGARGVMIKPLVVKELINLVQSMLEEQE